MGTIARRFSRLFIITVTVLFSLSSLAETKRYIVSLKSSLDYQSAKQFSNRPVRTGSGQQAVSFLGTRAAATDFLDHVEMVIIESSQRASIEAIKNHPLVEFVEEEVFFDPPMMPMTYSGESYVAQQQTDLTWGLKALNAEGAWKMTKGQGVRVLVLDSGLDEAHPDLAGRFEKGQSFMGNVLTDKIGHGTHVSGTILADGAGSGLLGVAPEARLLMAKVCDMTCSSAGITKGINWGIAEKVDVMNLSLGGPFLFPSQKKAYAAAEKANIIVVAAAGNDGGASLSYPAALPSVFSVGAVTPTLEKASFSQYGPTLDVVAPGVEVYSTVPVGFGRQSTVTLDLGNGPEEVKSMGFANSDPGSKITTGDLVFTGLGNPNDFSGKNVKGKIAFIERGIIEFEKKVTNARNAGAIGVIIFNNEPGLISGGLATKVTIPVAMIEQSVGQSVVAQLKSTTISSDMGMVATDFANYQGTSMASPHVAGLMALVRSVNKTMTAAQVRDLVRSTATVLAPNTKNELGRGLVNAEAAVMKASGN